jgi:hypothetical protein
LYLDIAFWLEAPSLTPSYLGRVTEEKQRRRRLDRSYTVGIIVGPEGTTPKQLEAIRELVNRPDITEVHAGTAMRLRLPEGLFRLHNDIPNLEARHKKIVKSSKVIVAAPREMEKPSSYGKWGVWSAVRYAKNRNLPVRIVMPNGKEG